MQKKSAKEAQTSEVAARWTEVRTPHFVVASNAGEEAARGVARDFEQIRALFHATFPELRVDAVQPIRIIVARDEATMRMITPDEWGGPEHVRPSGVFHSDGEKDYIVLRLDAEGTTAFHTSYHEYTHSLMYLNFPRLPLWVREGVAEFFGNSLLSEARATTGTIDRGHLFALSKNEWLPMETMFQVTGDIAVVLQPRRIRRRCFTRSRGRRCTTCCSIRRREGQICLRSIWRRGMRVRTRLRRGGRSWGI